MYLLLKDWSVIHKNQHVRGAVSLPDLYPRSVHFESVPDSSGVIKPKPLSAKNFFRVPSLVLGQDVVGSTRPEKISTQLLKPQDILGGENFEKNLSFVVPSTRVLLFFQWSAAGTMQMTHETRCCNSMRIYHHLMTICGGECDDKLMDWEYTLYPIFEQTHIPGFPNGMAAAAPAPPAGFFEHWNRRSEQALSGMGSIFSLERRAFTKEPEVFLNHLQLTQITKPPQKIGTPVIVAAKSKSSSISGLYSNGISNATGNWVIVVFQKKWQTLMSRTFGYGSNLFSTLKTTKLRPDLSLSVYLWVQIGGYQWSMT